MKLSHVRVSGASRQNVITRVPRESAEKLKKDRDEIPGSVPKGGNRQISKADTGQRGRPTHSAVCSGGQGLMEARGWPLMCNAAKAGFELLILRLPPFRR